MRRPPSMSLRFKLTALYVSLLALLLTGFGVYLYYDISHFLVDHTAVGMRAQAKPVVERWLSDGTGFAGDGGIDDIAQSLSWDLSSANTVAVVLDERGAQLAQGKRLAEEPDPVPANITQVAAALDGDNEVTYIAEVDGVRQLVALIPLRPAPGAPSVLGVVQLNTPLTEVDGLLSQQRLLIGGGILVLLAVGTAGGLWLTTSALAPLRRMILTCREIAAGDLRQRLALPRHHETGQLAAAFDEMVDRIEASFAAQRRFSADAAHELRTPLTALQGSLEVLLRNAHDDPATVRRLHQGMHGEVSRLNRLAEQLLDVSRIQSAAALHTEPLSVSAFLDDFVPHARLLAPDRRVSLERGPATTILADPDALNQAMYNVVDNAAQHTNPGGRISLSWRCVAHELELEVRDDGEGIDQADLPHVFEPFYRGDRSRSRRRGGTGLGLALSRTIIDEHGGRMRIESESGQGTRVVMCLPVVRDPSDT